MGRHTFLRFGYVVITTLPDVVLDNYFMSYLIYIFE